MSALFASRFPLYVVQALKLSLQLLAICPGWIQIRIFIILFEFLKPETKIIKVKSNLSKNESLDFKLLSKHLLHASCSLKKDSSLCTSSCWILRCFITNSLNCARFMTSKILQKRRNWGAQGSLFLVKYPQWMLQCCPVFFMGVSWMHVSKILNASYVSGYKHHEYLENLGIKSIKIVKTLEKSTTVFWRSKQPLHGNSACGSGQQESG